MFAEGLCSDLPGWTDRQMATWPPRGAFVALTVWLGGVRKIMQPLFTVTFNHAVLPPVHAPQPHPVTTGNQSSASKQTVFPSSEHWSKKTLWWRDRSWQTLLQKGNQQSRSWVQESGHYLPIVYNHRKKLLFTICRPVLIEIAPSMN